MIQKRRLLFAAIGTLAIATASSAPAKQSHRSRADAREAVALSSEEAASLLAAMRTYLETIDDIVAAMAENKLSRVADIAAKSGAKQLQGVDPLTGLKVPLGFTSLSLDTHDKFDRLSEKARQGTSRGAILSDLRDIMANCVSCHQAYRLAP